MNRLALLALPLLLLPLQAQDEYLPETIIVAADQQPFNPGAGTLADPLEVPYTLSLQPTENRGTLRDAVRWDPAVSSQIGNGVFDFFTLRGFDSLTGVNVAIDGVVEPETSFYHLHNIEQVQIAKGPFSTFFGRDALAGNVNLIRKQPFAENERALGIEFGSFGTLQLDADLNFDHLTRVNLLYKSSDGYRDGIDNEAYNLTLAKTFPINDRSALTGFIDYTRNEYTPDSGIPTLGDRLVPGIKDTANFQSDGEFSEQEILRLGLNYELDLNDRWTLQNRAYFTDFEWQSSGSIFGSFVAFGAGLEQIPQSLARIRPDLDDHQRIYGNHIAFRGDLDTQQVILGAEWRKLTDEFTLPIEVIDDINIFTRQTSPGLLPPIPGQQGDAELNELSLYAIDQVQLTDKLKILAGIRAQHFEFEDSTQNSERDDSELSGTGGILYDLTPFHRAYANVGTAYATPSTQVQGPRGAPEESVSAEAGLKFANPDSPFTSNVAVYWINRENIAIPTSTGVSSANGEQTSTGLEATVTWAAAEDIRIAAGYNYLNAELDNFAEFDQRGLQDQSGNTPAFAPEHTLTLRGEVDLTEDLALTGGLVYTDEQFIAPDNVFAIDAQTYTELGLTYRQPMWLGRLTVRNLLDEELLGRGAGATSVRPEDGLGFFGRIETKF